jgi:hypothetical protein
MSKNVRFEHELYLPMCKWLEIYLHDKYRKQQCNITVIDSHAVNLDSVLESNGVISDFHQTVGLQISIDVLGIVKWKNQSKIFFIEAKKTALTLQHLGQLWAYCKLCNPEEAFLLSSVGLGSLDKILKGLKREDMLDFGDGKTIKRMKIAKWDVMRSDIDNHSLVPKI